jgi:hypothetical protein
MNVKASCVPSFSHLFFLFSPLTCRIASPALAMETSPHQQHTGEADACIASVPEETHTPRSLRPQTQARIQCGAWAESDKEARADAVIGAPPPPPMETNALEKAWEATQ